MLEPLFVKHGVDVAFAGHEHVYERVHPQNGIYFTEGASGQLRAGNLGRSTITDKGFDTDRSFMLIEIGGEDMYFQTISRAGVTVDSGSFRCPHLRPHRVRMADHPLGTTFDLLRWFSGYTSWPHFSQLVIGGRLLCGTGL